MFKSAKPYELGFMEAPISATEDGLSMASRLLTINLILLIFSNNYLLLEYYEIIKDKIYQ